MTWEGLSEAIEHSQEREALANSLYQALRNQGQLGKHRALAYRCPSRCLVFDIVNTPEGLLVAVPRYKTSPDVTQGTSSESGRRANTEDGDSRWKGWANFMGRDVGNQLLACDHLNQTPLAGAAIHEDLGVGHTEVVVRSDGTRYAVG